METIQEQQDENSPLAKNLRLSKENTEIRNNYFSSLETPKITKNLKGSPLKFLMPLQRNLFH